MTWGAGVKAVASPDHSKDPTFTLAIWRQNGGAALGNDSAPSVLGDVAVANILPITGKRDAIVVMGNGVLRIIANGGTTITVQPWFYDNTLAVWVKFGATVTTTPGGAPGAVTLGAMVGAKFFCQITANTGVTGLGYDYV